jgi:DnaA-homolog protein
MRQLALPVRLRAAAVFDSYWAGPNAEIVTALRTAGTAPVWLWGAQATGKTHLLQAACAAAGSAAAAYFPLDRNLGLPADALQGLASRGLVCIDDVEAIAGEGRWERALFELYNEAQELRTRLIFAAAAAPPRAGLGARRLGLARRRVRRLPAARTR